jgi:hypothetical protein
VNELPKPGILDADNRITGTTSWPKGINSISRQDLPWHLKSPMDQPKKLSPETLTQLRRLAHDLSNSIETIMQASYLLGQSKLDANGKKWVQMIESAAEEASRVNRSIREILRSYQEKSASRRRSA